MGSIDLKFRYVHFVGSIPFASVDEVFREAGTLLGEHLRRMPDGELGPRLGWIRCQRPVFEGHDAIELAAAEADWRDGSESPTMTKFRIKPTVDASTLRFGSLGYADWAIASYRKFLEARHSGIFPEACRFQVCLPTPYAVTNVMVERASHAAVAVAYGRALKAEIDRLISNIPTRDLAVQWDVAQEIECLASGADAFYPISLRELAASLAKLAGY